jgi:hypothetical protein
VPDPATVVPLSVSVITKRTPGIVVASAHVPVRADVGTVGLLQAATKQIEASRLRVFILVIYIHQVHARPSVALAHLLRHVFFVDRVDCLRIRPKTARRWSKGRLERRGRCGADRIASMREPEAP